MKKERGSTIVIAMMALLIFMGLAASMNFSGQSQANLASAVKLQQFYETASLNAFNHVRAVLSDEWVDVDLTESSADDNLWRFGSLLSRASAQGDGVHGNFPGDPFDFSMGMNSGMLDLTYKIWVQNNPDDPSFMYEGYKIPSGSVVNTDWDMDGKIIVTVEVFSSTSPTIPVFTQSATLSPVGGEYANLYEDAVTEGNESDTTGQGQGTAGEAGSISLDGLK